MMAVSRIVRAVLPIALLITSHLPTRGRASAASLESCVMFLTQVLTTYAAGAENKLPTSSQDGEYMQVGNV